VCTRQGVAIVTCIFYFIYVTMIFRSSWISRDVPTAVLFLPVLWFTLAISPNLNEWRCLWVLVIVQLMVFGSINAYTNYHDYGLVMRYGFISKRGVHVLLYVSIVLFLGALVLAYSKIGLLFSILILLYGVVMLTYNYATVDWKEHPWASVIIISVFQGAFLVITYYAGINKLPLDHVLVPKVLIPAGAVSLLIASFCSLSRGKKIKRQNDPKAEIRLSLVLFVLASVVSLWYLTTHISSTYLNSASMLIVLSLAFLIRKYRTLYKRRAIAIHYTRLFYWSNWIAVVTVNIFLFWLFIDYTQVIQLLQF
jgi:hypothetical protein